MLTLVQDLISDDGSRLAGTGTSIVPTRTDCRNGKPRAIRDRLAAEEYRRLIEAARAGVCKKQLAAEYGISRRSIDRLAIAGIVRADQ
jgi:acetyl-CoA acetyltransferase